MRQQHFVNKFANRIVETFPYSTEDISAGISWQVFTLFEQFNAAVNKAH